MKTITMPYGEYEEWMSVVEPIKDSGISIEQIKDLLSDEKKRIYIKETISYFDYFHRTERGRDTKILTQDEILDKLGEMIKERENTIKELRTQTQDILEKTISLVFGIFDNKRNFKNMDSYWKTLLSIFSKEERIERMNRYVKGKKWSEK